MNSKKAITLLVLATLIMGILPVIPAHAAITLTDVYDPDGGTSDKGVYGNTFVIEGTGVTAGKLVKVYWDAVDNWDGETGFLNSTKASKSGSFELWFDIPEALNGEHYIWLEDANTGETYMVVDPIFVRASIKLSPDAGLEKDTITIKGYGYGDETVIRLVNATDLTLAVTDNETITTSPASPETNSKGTWTATFKVPAWGYDEYNISAADEDWVMGSDIFTCGPAVTLDIESGPTGTVVRATGRGFEDDGTIDYVDIYDANDNNVSYCYVLDDTDLEISGRGLFTMDLVIPNVPEVDDGYYLRFEDSNGDVGTADFEVTGLPGLEASPEYGPVGSTITVKGYNFTQVSGETVVLTLDGIGDTEVETTSKGEFTANFRIPGASGTVKLMANMTAYNLSAVMNFRVGFITVVINPETVPSGALVSVSGSGFVAGREWNATLDGDLWIDNPAAVTAGGVISADINVPSMEPGVYEVVITEYVSGISVISELTVTENTYVETNPVMAPAGFNITIEGYNFAEDPGANSDLTFVLYNSTDDWDIDAMFEGANVALEDDPEWDPGYFWATFLLPLESEIDIGSYTLNVTDGVGMFTQYTFNIVDKTVDIEPRKSSFSVGDTVAFNVESSFQQDNSYIKIWDPTGNLYWETDPFAPAEWLEVGTIMRVPYYQQVAGGNPMTLLEDAPLGTWEWTWYDGTADHDELDAGTFTVVAAAADVVAGQVEDLANQITDLASQLSDVTGEFDDVKSDIADLSAIAEQAVTAAQQAVQAVQTVAQTANQANTAAQNAADAANAAKDAANSLTTLVYGAIGAALVAALAAIVSLMQISRRIAG